MKLSSALILLLGTTFPLVAHSSFSEQDDLIVLLDLIETSKKGLEEQRKLLQQIIDFKKAREAFIAEPTSSKLAKILVTAAAAAYHTIESSQLTYLFSSDFISEIRFFTQVGEKHTPKGNS